MADLTKLVQKHKDYVKEQMTSEERMLVFLREELYSGNWSDFETDLKEKLDKKPHIFKLVNRIELDLKRLDKIRNYESLHEVNLADYVKNFEQEEGDKKSPY